MENEHDGAGRFDDGTTYSAARPSYPAGLISFAAELISAVPKSSPDLVVDVGAGTGLFTGQIAAALPADIQVFGIEPSASMRAAAVNNGQLRMLDGKAEALPFGDRALRAVTAATAAHWFDRKAFYGEAARVLRPDGVLLIAEYVRAEASSPAAAAVQRFLDEHGDGRAYLRPDYRKEMAALDGFKYVREYSQNVMLSLDPDEFVALALSSSHAKPIITRYGRSRAEDLVISLTPDLANAAGMILFGYLFKVTAASRLGEFVTPGI